MKLVALDIESAGLSAKSDPNTPIWCVGFAHDDRSYILKFAEAKEHITELLNDEDVIFIIHNAAFDVAALRCHGVNIPSGRYICTRLMTYCSNTQEQNGLDILSRKYLGDNKAPIKDELINVGIIGKSDDHWGIDYGSNEAAYIILAEYCKHDAELCLKLYYWLWENRYKSDEKLQRSFFWTELPYVECVIDMEATGMYINTSLLDELTSLITDELTNINERINNVVGLLPEKVAWNNELKTYFPVDKTYSNGVSKNKRNADIYYSTGVDGCYSSSSPSFVYNHTPVTTLNPEASHFTWLLMERLGWKPERLSKKTGEPTTDKQVMNELENEYPVVADVKRRRELEKLQGSFIGKLRGIASNGERPFVRCNYNQCKTITTRLSSSEINLQNIPSRGKLGKRIRDAVIAPPGYDLWVADLN